MERETEGFPLTSIREVRVLMQCKHPNIVAVKVRFFLAFSCKFNLIYVFQEIVVGPGSNDVSIVMEYLEHDLKNILEDMSRCGTQTMPKIAIFKYDYS